MPNSELIGLAPTTITGLNRLGYFWCRHQEFSIDSLNQRSTYHFAEKSKYMYMTHIIWALLSINYPVWIVITVCGGAIATPDVYVDEFRTILSYNQESFRFSVTWFYWIRLLKRLKSSVEVADLLVSPRFQSDFMDPSSEFVHIWTAARLTNPNEFLNEFGEIIETKKWYNFIDDFYASNTFTIL